MEASKCVAILLATYNGERYLDTQLASLLSQTHRDIVVMVRDDGSSDRTPEILQRWKAEHPDRFRIVSDELGNLRSLRNFSRLMELCDAPYFAFCDQDDVWLPNKVELALDRICDLEGRLGETTPILVHSDLKLVDDDLNEISPSLFSHWHLDLRKAGRLDHMIINNIVAGCASMGNRALLQLARPIPEGILCHDWWVALIAASCGVLQTITEPTILYRQHDRNQVGAGQYRNATLWDARHILQQPILLKSRMTKAMRIMQSQAVLLLRVMDAKMPRHNREFLRAFCLPRQRDAARALPAAQRAWLVVRALAIYARAFPLALRWCY